MDSKLRVCTIGGGSGMPVVNKALLRIGIGNITSIVTTFDSGGDTGRLRTDERGRILAYSDYWRSLMSLWVDGKQKELWEEMLRYRDGRGRNFGNLFFQFMAEKQGGLDGVARYFGRLMDANIQGTVVPVTDIPGEICFETKSGRSFCGEHRLDEMRMSADAVKKIWLSQEVEANKEAKEALKMADVIIICPGSLYGSVIINFLPKGMSEAYRMSKAKKILLTNIMSVANENDGFDQNDYNRVFSEYLGKNCLDLIIMADVSVFPKKMWKNTLLAYKLERSYPIKVAKKCQCKTVVDDIAVIEGENGRLRHSEEKLARVLLDNIVR